MSALQGEFGTADISLHRDALPSSIRIDRHEEHNDFSIEGVSDVFLSARFEVDAAYLSKVMGAILAIPEWYPIWGLRSGRLNLKDGANSKPAWYVELGVLPVADQLPMVLHAFSPHYTTPDPSTLSTIEDSGMDIGRLMEWYTQFMLELPTFEEDILVEAQDYNIADKITIEAFAAWLRLYDGMEIRVEDMVPRQAPVDWNLASRFVEHAGLGNSEAAGEFKREEIFEGYRAG
ncbi:hypothetical protein FRB96_001432 [Tulasnella sp. 330]|nr:hypothetical protein FRB96_001432 [Tulasnella sp. 330]